MQAQTGSMIFVYDICEVRQFQYSVIWVAIKKRNDSNQPKQSIYGHHILAITDKYEAKLTGQVNIYTRNNQAVDSYGTNCATAS